MTNPNGVFPELWTFYLLWKLIDKKEINKEYFILDANFQWFKNKIRRPYRAYFVARSVLWTNTSYCYFLQKSKWEMSSLGIFPSIAMGFFWESQREVKCHASRSRHDSECYLGQPGLFVKTIFSVFKTIFRSHRHLSTYTAAYYCDVFKSLYKKYIKKNITSYS